MLAMMLATGYGNFLNTIGRHMVPIYSDIKHVYACVVCIALWNCACPVIEQFSNACAWLLEHRSVDRQKCLLVHLVIQVGPMQVDFALALFFCACVKIFNINSVELDLSKRMHSQCASIMLYNHPQGVIFVCPCRPRLEDQPTTSPLAESPAQHGFVSFQDTGVLSAD